MESENLEIAKMPVPERSVDAMLFETGELDVAILIKQTVINKSKGMRPWVMITEMSGEIDRIIYKVSVMTGNQGRPNKEDLEHYNLIVTDLLETLTTPEKEDIPSN